MDHYTQEKLMFGKQNEIAAHLKHATMVRQAKQSHAETEAETGETIRMNFRQQLGQSIIRFGYKVAGRTLISLEVNG